MPRSISRATISSLKATQTAHRMANEVLHPVSDLPVPFQAAGREIREERNWHKLPRCRQRSFDIYRPSSALLKAALILGVAMLLLWVLFVIKSLNDTL